MIELGVTNTGDVYGWLRQHPKDFRKGWPNVKKDTSLTAKLFYLRKETGTLHESTLDVQGRLVQNLHLTSGQQGRINVFGLYYNKGTDQIGGIFTADADPLRPIQSCKLVALPTSLLSELKLDKQASPKGDNAGLSFGFGIRDVVAHQNGATDYILSYIKYEWYKDDYFPAGDYLHYFGSMLVIRVNDQSVGFTRIPRWLYWNQCSFPFGAMRTASFNNKLVLFYNDDPDNLQQSLDKGPKESTKRSKSVLAMAVVDEKGQLTRSAVYHHSTDKSLTSIADCVMANARRMAVLAKEYNSPDEAGEYRYGWLEW